MQFYYTDSSVLVKRHVTESGSQWFCRLAEIGAGRKIISSHVSEIEVYSALARRMRLAEFTPDEHQEMSAQFHYVWTAEYISIVMSDEIVSQAKRLVKNHPLRAYDAIQLASAIVVNAEISGIKEADLIFLAADRRLLSVAAS